MHIVIIEDEQEIRQELSQLLRDSLYEVTAVEQFDNLAEIVLEIQPDLVLLDLNLPGVSGLMSVQKSVETLRFLLFL